MTNVEILLSIMLWVLCIQAGAVIAHGRGVRADAGGLFGFLFGPLGVLLCLILPQPPKPPPARGPGGERRPTLGDLERG